MSGRRMSCYYLPCHPTKLCQDPLSICQDNIKVATTVWDVISTAISSTHTSESLPDLIESLVYSIHGNGSVDTRGLRDFLQRNYPHPSFYPALRKAALSLPHLFPNHEIPYLNNQNHASTFTAEQLNALLAHQLLGTLDRAAGGWDYPTFLCWYAGDNPHSMAVEGYLTTLFHHFCNIEAYPPSWHLRVLFSVLSEDQDGSWEDSITPMQMDLISVDEESEPSLPDSNLDLKLDEPPAVVVSSNRQPGFGPSGTQEERVFSMSILLCPLVLICPTLPPEAALITSPTPIHAAWRGHNRTARLTSLFPTSDRPNRYHLFLDALELDTHTHRDQSDSLPDLAPNHLHRELRKFYTGCMALRTLSAPSQPPPPPVLEAGPWGCGAFGGNAVIKAVLMALASSHAGVQLQLRLPAARTNRDAEMILALLRAGLTVGGVVAAMNLHRESFMSCRDAGSFVRLLLGTRAV